MTESRQRREQSGRWALRAGDLPPEEILRAVPGLGDVANNAAFRLLRFRDRGRGAARRWALAFALATPVASLFLGGVVPGIAEGMILGSLLLYGIAVRSSHDARELLSRPRTPDFEALHLAPLSPADLVSGACAAALSRSRIGFARWWSRIMFAGSWIIILAFDSPYRTEFTNAIILCGLAVSIVGLVEGHRLVLGTIVKLIVRLSSDLDEMVATYYDYEDKKIEQWLLDKLGMRSIVIHGTFYAMGFVVFQFILRGAGSPLVPLAWFLSIGGLALYFLRGRSNQVQYPALHSMLVSYARRHREVRMERPHLAPWA